MRKFIFLSLLAASAAGAAQAPSSKPRNFIFPPKAAEPAGAISQVELSPLFRQPYMCSEHFVGQIPYAGDSLGADCYPMGGVEGDSGFMRPFRTDGATNADWYGWHVEVLSPTDGVVVGLIENQTENVPGQLGKPPAGMIQIERPDGILVTLGHVTHPGVKLHDRVVAGQPIAKVGNNGFGRAPHIHIGAYKLATAEPFQIRWDLRAMATLQTDDSPAPQSAP